MTKMRTDHIVVHERGLKSECQHCGQTLQIKLPVSVDIWLKAAEQFRREHAACPAPVRDKANDV